jgi:hypothetical protein
MGMGAIFARGGFEDESEEMRQLRLDAEWLVEKCEAYEVLRREAQWIERWFRESAGEGSRNDGGVLEDIDAETIQLYKTHRRMVKFSGEKDEDWVKVERCLVGLRQILFKS